MTGSERDLGLCRYLLHYNTWLPQSSDIVTFHDLGRQSFPKFYFVLTNKAWYAIFNTTIGFHLLKSKYHFQVKNSSPGHVLEDRKVTS